MNSGKSRPYGSPVAGLVDDGPVVPWQPPSRFAQTTWKRSVSTGLARADQRVPPVRGLGVAGQRVADVDDRVRRVAVARVGDLERRDPRAGLELETSPQDERLNHACAWRR